MFSATEIFLKFLYIVSAISFTLSIIILPWLFYKKVRNVASKLLIIGSFLFIGGAVFTLVISLSSGGQTLIHDAIKYTSTPRLLFSSLGKISISISLILFTLGLWHHINSLNYEKLLNHKSFKKTILQTFISFLFVFSIACSGYVLYQYGAKSTHFSSTIPYMQILKMQNECINNENAKCIKVTNSMALQVLTINLKEIKNRGISNDNEKEINNYLDWYEKNK